MLMSLTGQVEWWVTEYDSVFLALKKHVFKYL